MHRWHAEHEDAEPFASAVALGAHRDSMPEQARATPAALPGETRPSGPETGASDAPGGSNMPGKQ